MVNGGNRPCKEDGLGYLFLGVSRAMKQAKPFQYRGWWVSKIQGKLTKLRHVRVGERKTAPDDVVQIMLTMRSSATVTPQDNATVADVATKYLAMHVGNPKTIRKNKSNLQTLVTMYGELKFSMLTKLHAQQWQLAWIKHYKPKTWADYVKTARALVKWAIVNGYTIKENVFKALSLPAHKGYGRKRRATTEEYAKLFRMADREHKRILMFFRYTAARPQDVYQCQWSWWNGSTITIPHDQHKTGAESGEERVILLDSRLQRMLRYMKRTASSSYIFAGQNLQKLDSWFARLREDAGIGPDDKYKEQLVLYHIRHMRVTEAIEKWGADVAQRIAGHKNIATTIHYDRRSNDDIIDMLG